ncbi:molecular chaperone DnaK [Marinobacterium nitratireducens]|uniref:Molecular chaperone DnaK n=1 Tax=Marinobacterium nitratireducens TaxID=518897 RepID=A0A917ZGJ6_9GAMM|nr:Hsp70 family protein [Marinobacterium nitratireducens]GGO81654.1 molecular chaperone DnaK [Marinobacterium nitratireducens]
MSDEQNSARYAVGIDLGTTHCVLSYVDLEAGDDAVLEVMPVPQLTAPGSVEEKWQLPSFVYQPHESELSDGDLGLPWEQAPAVVGTLARELGSKTPIRLVASAKSWLCHGGVDRHSAFLPLNSPEEVPKLSPLDATGQYLEHLRRAWDYWHPDAPLLDQDVTITVPASFDPAARELTADVARDIGFRHLTLLEEPQAAVYSWIEASQDAWRDEVGVGDIILVVDIGGGTSDFSLVAVTEDDGNLQLNRVAVGDHILLGGDNMDLALAYRLKAKLAQQGTNLQPWQVMGIVHACRDAKEKLLADPEVESVPIVVPSRGSKLLGGTLRTELTRDEVREALVEGFFPQVGIDEHPAVQARGALTQMGLPYAQDAAISRHLAAFLSRQHGAADELLGESGGDFIKPTRVLFNGGVLKAPALSERTLGIINGWLDAAGAPEATLLSGLDLDLAVARGSAYYGAVRQGQGVRIRGGIASAYYVGIESAMPAIPGMEPPVEALCVAPFGMEEGSETQVPGREFGLVVGEPVRFRFFGSTIRREDEAGTLLDFWEPDEIEELPEIQATLPVEGRTPGEVVPVRLASRVTEVGTLRLEAIPRDGAQRWQVELDVREQ